MITRWNKLTPFICQRKYFTFKIFIVEGDRQNFFMTKISQTTVYVMCKVWIRALHRSPWIVHTIRRLHLTRCAKVRKVWMKGIPRIFHVTLSLYCRQVICQLRAYSCTQGTLLIVDVQGKVEWRNCDRNESAQQCLQMWCAKQMCTIKQTVNQNCFWLAVTGYSAMYVVRSQLELRRVSMAFEFQWLVAMKR